MKSARPRGRKIYSAFMTGWTTRVFGYNTWPRSTEWLLLEFFLFLTLQSRRLVGWSSHFSVILMLSWFEFSFYCFFNLLCFILARKSRLRCLCIYLWPDFLVWTPRWHPSWEMTSLQLDFPIRWYVALAISPNIDTLVLNHGIESRHTLCKPLLKACIVGACEKLSEVEVTVRVKLPKTD